MAGTVAVPSKSLAERTTGLPSSADRRDPRNHHKEAQDDGDMATPHSKDSLEILDKSDLDLSELTDHAASVLKVDLAEESKKHLERHSQDSSITGYSFREQWVLRWLLRQIASEQTLHNKPDNIQASSTKSWVLLLHLLDVIPQSVSAEILAERNFLQCLDPQLRQALRTYSAIPRADDVQVSGYGVVAITRERPSKRRRLSPEHAPASFLGGGSSAETIEILFRVCCRFADIVASHSVLGKHNEHSAGLAWTTSVQENARTFAASLQVALTSFRIPASGNSGSTSFSHVQKLLALWNCRPVAVSDVSKAHEVVAFNTSCLSPCFELLDLCTRLSPNDEGAKACALRLEKLLALHTVLPLRTKFHDQQSKQWNQSRLCLNWVDILPVYKDMAVVLAPQKQSSDTQIAEMLDVDWKSWSPHLYSIAIRLIPKSDHRRKQWEQPWLDALFITLCYLSSPALPRLNIEAPNIITRLESGPPPDTDHGLDAVNGLLRVALEQHTSVPLQLLSYVASAVLSCDTGRNGWTLLSNMISLDVNIFIPGLGVPTTNYSINKLRERLHDCVCSETDYGTIRDGIMLPLIPGFARTRALRDFIEMWRTDMMIAMDLAPNEDGTSQAMKVWEDESVFDEVSDMAGQHATAALIQEVFSTTLQNLEERAGPFTTQSLANAAVCAAFVHARQNGGVDPSNLENVQAAALAVLKQQSHHHSDRWRLWKLVASIQEMQTSVHLAADVLTASGGGDENLSLHSLKTAGNAGNLQPSQLRERLERFLVLVQQAAKRNRPFLDALQTEIDALQGFIGTLAQNEALWNGRTADLNSTNKLISACLGTLLSQPAVLHMYPHLALRLMQKLEAKSGHNSQPEGTLRITPCVRDLFHSVLVSVHSNGSRQVTNELDMAMLEAAVDPKLEDAPWELIASLRIESISKSRLRNVASAMFDRLSAINHEISLARLAAYLSLMDRVAAHCSVSFCQGKSWSRWVDILSTLDKRKSEDDENRISAVRRCTTSILRKVFISLVDEAVKAGSDVLSPVLKWCKRTTKLFTPIKYGISRFLALQTCMSVICDSIDKLAESVTKSFRKLCREYVRRLSDAVITILDGTPRISDTAYVDLVGLLQALSDVETGSPVPEDLISLVQSSELACQESFASHFDDPGGFPELFLALSALLGRYLNHWTPKRTMPPQSKVAMKTSLAYPKLRHSVSDQQQLELCANRADNLVRTLDVEGQADLLESMAQGEHRDAIGPMVPCMVAAVVLGSDGSRFSQSPRLVRYLADVPRLSGCFLSMDQPQILLTLENARVTLNLHSKVINQATIDSLLGNLSLLLSSLSTAEHHYTNADAIFDRIIAIIGSLLGRFRRRLSDRHHLLLPILQPLLRCLFYAGSSKQHFHRQPAQGSNPTVFLKGLPPWLRSSIHPLPASSAEKYTRIISSICNPTVSAAKSSSSGKRSGAAAELNDETKRVKTLAGEHMQYLVMEYCRCSLDGEITPQARDKLMPGMYIVLESMSRDLMRGMNAAMDPSSKAIFKALYDDWVRYGKWDRS